jgi:cytochrome c553
MISMRSFFFVCCTVALANPAWANEEAVADNGMKFEDKLASCGACHGENGAKPIMPEYPILAGQHANYLANALGDYRSGSRTNPIMAAQIQALQLTDSDIHRLADHFSKQMSGLTILKNK